MQVIGLRFRFQVAIFFILLLISFIAIFSNSIFLEQERLKLIDQQVRDTATALVDSRLGELRKIDFDTVDDIISEELGESRIGKFFIIRNTAGDIVFESAGARVIPIAEFPREHQWHSLKVGEKFIRILNLRLPRIDDRTLQVGLVVDRNIMAPNYLSDNSIFYLLFIMIIGLVVSYFLTSFLLKPLLLFRAYLTEIKSNPGYQSRLPQVPIEIRKYTNSDSIDEFTSVVDVFDELVKKINFNMLSMKQWTNQMAHELKTPLSVLAFEVEVLGKKVKPDLDGQYALIEIRKMSDIINSFLNWAELENTDQRPQLFANNLSGSIEEVIDRFFKGQKHRIMTKFDDKFIVPSDPQHLTQLISNLIDNALKYSSVSDSVEVLIIGREMHIKDKGPGIPKEVRDKIGQPFNKFHITKETKGHGLGLAWVQKICSLYGWKFQIDNHEDGTLIKIEF